MSTSLIPPGMTRLPRYVLHPYGSQGPSFTIALYGAGYDVIAYRVTVCEDKRSRPVWAGTIQTQPGHKDWANLASEIIKQITVRPGDVSEDTADQLTPEQLAIVLAHGPSLRAEAAKRFNWSPAEARPLRSDLPALYSRRRTSTGTQHRFTVGQVTAEGTTRADARQAVQAACLNHLSAVPVFRVDQTGPELAKVLALYPRGDKWEVQEILPDRPNQPLGVRYHLTEAKDSAEARQAFERLGKPTRGKSGTYAKTMSVRPSRRAVGA